MSRVSIVGLAGSLAQHSASLSALRLALEGARDYGAAVQLFDLRALRGWAVPLVLPIPQAWQVFKEGRVLDKRVEEQLRALGHELARAAQLFAAGAVTTLEASTVEAQVEPLR